MKHKIRKTELEYKQAMDRMEKIFDSKPQTAEGNELELISLLIDNYENENYHFR